MYDGIMPPVGKSAAANADASQIQTIPLVVGLPLPTNGAAVGVLSKQWDHAAPRVLSLGFPMAAPVGFPAFPDGPGESLFPSAPAIVPEGCGIVGLQSGAPVALGGSATVRAACILEWGTGAATQKACFDWLPGGYNVPSCSWARVSILPWGTDWDPSVLTMPACAALTTGVLEDAFQPTVTGIGLLLAADDAFTMVTPSNARAVEVTSLNLGSSPPAAIQLSGSGTVGVIALRDYTTSPPQFTPPWSPVDCHAPGSSLVLSVSADAMVWLRFYLQL